VGGKTEIDKVLDGGQEYSVWTETDLYILFVEVETDAFPETTEAIVERSCIERLSDETIFLASEILTFLFVETSWACFSAFQRGQSFEKAQWAARQFEHFTGFSQPLSEWPVSAQPLYCNPFLHDRIFDTWNNAAG